MLGSIIRVSYLSAASFLPHYLRVLSRGNTSDISLYYVLFNLVSATHQFALGCLYVISAAGKSTYFVHGAPPTTLDWLNLGQFAVVFLCFLIFFVFCLLYPSDQSWYSKCGVVVVYTVVLLLYLAPQVLLINEEWEDKLMFLSMYYSAVFFYINYIITALGIASLFAQWPQATALSPRGLALQAVVFTLVAISWVLLAHFDPNAKPSNIGGLTAWYLFVGFAAVDNAVFAAVQAVLFYNVWRGTGGGNSARSLETEPLLGSVASS